MQTITRCACGLVRLTTDSRDASPAARELVSKVPSPPPLAGTILGPPSSAHENRIYSLTVVCGMDYPVRNQPRRRQSTGMKRPVASNLAFSPLSGLAGAQDKPPKVQFVSKVNMNCVNQQTGLIEPRSFPLLANWQRKTTIEASSQT